jgi:type IV pilus assembly protein PilM
VAATVIGLDIGTTRARAVEIQMGRSGPTVLRYAEAPLPLGAVQDGEVTEPEGVVPALRQMWAQAKFSHKDVNIGVGNQRVLVRSLDLPWMPLTQLRSSLPFQVQDTLPVAVEDALLDFYPTGEYQAQTGRTVQGLLVAATRDTVAANVGAVESAGLRPRMVDLNAFALLRAHQLAAPAASTVALVDVGARITNVVVTRNGQPQMVRTLASGGQHVTDAVAAEGRLSVSEAEAMKRQIGVGFAVSEDLKAAAEVVAHVTQTLVEAVRNTLVYYASTHPGAAVELVVLTGGGSYLNGLGQYLSSASRLPVTMGDVLSGLNVAKSAHLQPLAGLESTFALPLGLALGVAA